MRNDEGLRGRFLSRSLAGFANGLLVLGCLLSSSTSAQEFPINPPSSSPTTQGQGLREVGRTAETAVGEVGQRKTTSAAAPNVEPMRRVNNRIENRVRNRIANRIDRSYDPRANATEPFRLADDDVREASRSP